MKYYKLTFFLSYNFIKTSVIYKKYPDYYLRRNNMSNNIFVIEYNFQCMQFTYVKACAIITKFQPKLESIKDIDNLESHEVINM